MRRTLTSIALSCVLAASSIAATARPAKADDELIGQLLLGAVAVGVAYHFLRQQDRSAPVVSRAPQTQQAAPSPRTTQATTVRTAPPSAVLTSLRPRPRVLPTVAQDPIVPWTTWTTAQKRSACQQTLPTRRGEVDFIADRCLNHPRAEPRIPQNCLRDRWVRGAWRQVYSRDCLDRYGEVL